jgi:hypothetical protein
MPVYDWSQTADTDASADPTINYEIGMAPSAVGSSGRAVTRRIAAPSALSKAEYASAIPPYGLGTRQRRAVDP